MSFSKICISYSASDRIAEVIQKFLRQELSKAENIELPRYVDTTSIEHDLSQLSELEIRKELVAIFKEYTRFKSKTTRERIRKFIKALSKVQLKQIQSFFRLRLCIKKNILIDRRQKIRSLILFGDNYFSCSPDCEEDSRVAFQ